MRFDVGARRCSTVDSTTVKSRFLQGAGRRRNGPGQTRVCAVVTGGGGRLFGHLLGEPGATSFLLEGTIPYDKHAYLGYLGRQNRALPAGYCSAESAVALARAARDRAMALTQKIDRWPDCAGVSATATIVSHYPRRGGYRVHAASADADDAAKSYYHEMVKGARERPAEDEAVAHLALRACADVAGVPEAISSALRTHGILLEPITATNAVGEVAEGVETVPEAKHVPPEEVTARVWVPGRELPIVAPATLPDNAVIVPYEEGKGLPLAAEALHALGREGEEGDGPWIDPPAPVLVSTGPMWPVEPPAPPEITNWGWLELDDDDDHLARLLRRFPRATYALTADAALRLVSDRDRAIAATSGGATFAVQRGAVEAAKRAWELPKAALAAFTWIGAADNDVRNVVAYAKTGCGSKPDLTGLSSGEHFEGRVTDLTDGSPSTEIGTGRYAGGWADGKPSGKGVMEWDNGITFDGEWRDGQFHGFGAKRYSRGGGYEGQWESGKRQGRGTTFYAYGRWEGPFEGDRPHGEGTMYVDGEGEGKPFRFDAGKPLDGKEPKHRG